MYMYSEYGYKLSNCWMSMQLSILGYNVLQQVGIICYFLSEAYHLRLTKMQSDIAEEQLGEDKVEPHGTTGCYTTLQAYDNPELPPYTSLNSVDHTQTSVDKLATR